MTDLWRLTATEAVQKLRKRELSPLELVEAAVSRIEAVEPKINALPIRFFDEARDYAKRFKNESRDDPGWLAGLPMAVKDYNDVAGQLTTYGSPIFAEHRASADDRTSCPAISLPCGLTQEVVRVYLRGTARTFRLHKHTHRLHLTLRSSYL
jgi:amidase